MPVHHGQAVAGLERPLDLDLQGEVDPRRPIDDPLSSRPGVETPDLLDAHELALDETMPQPGVGLHGLHGGGHHGGVLGAQQHPGATHGLGDGRGAVGHHRDPGGHGLEDRHAETLVLAHRDEDPGAGERRPEQAVGDLAHDDHPVRDAEPLRLSRTTAT